MGQCSQCIRSDPFFPSHAGDLLMEFFKLCSKKESTEEILGRRLAEDESKGQVTDCTTTGVDDIQ